MASYEGKEGVWALYIYNSGAEAMEIWPDKLSLLEHHDISDGICFWPFGMTIGNAVLWWDETRRTKDGSRPQAE